LKIEKQKNTEKIMTAYSDPYERGGFKNPRGDLRGEKQ